jgi:uncharacterized repeat protein (TIGR02543 family)
MNKNTIYVSAIGILLPLFIACNLQGPDPERSSGYDGKAAVHIQVGVAGIQGRTVRPAVALQDVSAWALRGRKQGGEEALLAEFSSPEGATAAIEPGTWSFSLVGSKNGVVILSGTIAEQTISLTGTKTLEFTVAPVLEGEGVINLVIELPTGSGITEARVFKDDVELEAPLAPVGDKIVFAGTYAAGAYRFSIRLYKGTELYGAVSEAVYVWANLQSEKTYTLTREDLNLTYVISYHVWDGKTETGYYQYTDAALTLAAPSRQDYFFRGWYEHADLSGDAVIEIPAGSMGNKDFYAKWITATPTPSDYSLAESLAWISINAEEGGAYTITLISDEDIAPMELSYEGKKVDIVLTGGMVERTVDLGHSGSVFIVKSGVTLKLGSNITLRGRSDNTSALVQVDSGGTLEMQTGSKIRGNTSSGNGGGVLINGGTLAMNGGEISGNTAGESGGGVYVYDGTFIMSGGEISSNTANSGGGVYVAGGAFTKESGGVIYGPDAGDALKNSASGYSAGHAVYVSESKKRNTTVDTDITLDSAQSGAAGGWVESTLNNLSLNGGGLEWLNASAVDGGAYTIMLSDNETIAPITFSYSGKTVSITLSGVTAERTISLGSSGTLFTVGSGVTLQLGSNITLQGLNSNTSALVQVDNGGTLVMQTGSKISNNSSSGNGGGVLVNGGTFTMSGGEISGNSANSGGGVYVAGGAFTKEPGSVIYGSDASGTLKNSASSYHTGHVVYVSESRKRNTTVDTDITLDSTQSGAAGGWVESLPSNLSLSESLEWLSASAVESETYTIALNADETLASRTLSYSGKTVSIILNGVTAERTISLGSSGTLFTVGSGVTLTLGGNTTLQGLNSNTSALVQVDSGGTLLMQTDSKISNNASSGNGGGVLVNGGAFTMSGGEVSGNSASSGGGVYVASGTFIKESGGVMYGSNAGSTLKNSANSDDYGYAVYVDGSPAKIRNGTAGVGVTLDSSSSGSAGGWETPIPNNSSLVQSLEWLKSGAVEGGSYIIVLNAAESFAPQILSYSGKNVSITLKGDAAERILSSNSNGALFTVESGVTLTLDNNITLQGRSSNSTPLMRVNSGGTLTMESGSKIRENANTGSNGGGVLVNGGTFTMNGGEISGNTASNGYGGGVYVTSGGILTKQSGGTIYGSNADSALTNTANSESYGHAVYVNSSPAKICNDTAGVGVTLDSSSSGSAGGWE